MLKILIKLVFPLLQSKGVVAHYVVTICSTRLMSRVTKNNGITKY